MKTTELAYKPFAAIRLRDARYQNEIAGRLRAMPEDRALRFVQRFIAIDADSGLQVANLVIH